MEYNNTRKLQVLHWLNWKLIRILHFAIPAKLDEPQLINTF